MAEVASTQVEGKPPTHNDRQHTTNSGNKTPTVSSSYQDIKMVIGGRTLTVRGNARFAQIQNMLFGCKFRMVLTHALKNKMTDVVSRYIVKDVKLNPQEGCMGIQLDENSKLIRRLHQTPEILDVC